MKRILLLILIAAAGGCGEEATPAVVRERISRLVPPLVDGVAAAIDTVKQAPGLAVLGRVLGRLDSMVGKPDDKADKPRRGSARPWSEGQPSDLERRAEARRPDDKADEPRRGSARPWSEGQPSDLERRAEARRPDDNGDSDPGAELARKLSEEVFVDEAYEGNGIYRIDDDLRVQVEVDGDGLSFTLLAGDRAPLAIDLQPDQLAATLDVAQIPVDATLAEGRAALRLGRLNDHAWTATVSVDEAVRFEGGDWKISVAAGSPLASATVDLTAGTLAATVDVGPVTLSVPWDGSVLGVDLRGLTADVSLGDALSLRRLGFGATTSKVTLDGETLLALDWNPDAGRVVDVVMASGLGIDAIGFAPRLAVILTAHFEPLVAHDKAVPDWLLDEVYELRLGPEFALMGGGIEVLVEPLSLSARKAAASLNVPAGMCIFGDPLTQGEHPLIGRLAARVCPAN